MIYRKLGTTGLMASQLGFGAMRLPMTGEGIDACVDRERAVPMIHRAFEAGVNYIDTAVGYCNRDSQRAIGEALRGWRDRIIVSTKNHYYGPDEKEWWKNLEDSLYRLNIDCIDIYSHHGINWRHYEENVAPRLSAWMQKARDQGLIRHICTSFHDSTEALVKLVDTGYPEVITLQYNLLNRGLEEGIAYAAEKGIGIVVMGPVAGGRLGATSSILEENIPHLRKVPELALRHVLANPNVSVALSGMSTMSHVEENISVASDTPPLTEEQKRLIDDTALRIKELEKLYCTGCGYCEPCPNNVAISRIFEWYNLGRLYGYWDRATMLYREIGVKENDKRKKADSCIECGACEKNCPQNIEIIRNLKAAHTDLG
ncbi:MAG: 4Fe-4S dicluster domain-containing protein [Chitinivibrionales bacterium]|nr:4Fe-4S dicluster domain-containing protein [Chitinivibrionales bacterium]